MLDGVGELLFLRRHRVRGRRDHPDQAAKVPRVEGGGKFARFGRGIVLQQLHKRDCLAQGLAVQQAGDDPVPLRVQQNHQHRLGERQGDHQKHHQPAGEAARP